jgi:hypothetical protein
MYREAGGEVWMKWEKPVPMYREVGGEVLSGGGVLSKGKGEPCGIDIVD